MCHLVWDHTPCQQGQPDSCLPNTPHPVLPLCLQNGYGPSKNVSEASWLTRKSLPVKYLCPVSAVITFFLVSGPVPSFMTAVWSASQSHLLGQLPCWDLQYPYVSNLLCSLLNLEAGSIIPGAYFSLLSLNLGTSPCLRHQLVLIVYSDKEGWNNCVLSTYVDSQTHVNTNSFPCSFILEFSTWYFFSFKSVNFQPS